MQLDHSVVTSRMHMIVFEIPLKTWAVPLELIHASSTKALRLGHSMLASFVSIECSDMRAFVLEA